MFSGLKRSWRSFASAEPGQRFRQRYNARRRQDHNRLSGVLLTLGGLLLIVVGAVFLVIPGPGIPLVAVGMALMAQQFRWAAHAADWIELTWRSAMKKLKKLWKAAPVGVRVVAASLAVIAGTAAGYGAYKVVFG